MGLSRGWDPLAAGLGPTQASPRKQGLQLATLLAKERKKGRAQCQAPGCQQLAGAQASAQSLLSSTTE